jgi:putative acetyltransferase
MDRHSGAASQYRTRAVSDPSITIRPLRPGEARLFLELHRRSVQGLASGHYPPEVVEAWTVPPTDENLRRFEQNEDGEIRLIAELGGCPAGLGALVVANSELRACYVVPEAALQGVGTALVVEIERLAKAHGLDHLELLASINAQPFYEALGYRSDGAIVLTLRGQAMDAVKMSRRL